MAGANAPLEGKTAIVTGGATGIGAGVALRLAERGADVVITHFGHDPAATLDGIRALGRRGTAIRLDVRSSADVTARLDEIAGESGGIDIVVNNAGGLVARNNLQQATDEFWHNVIDLNLSSAFYVIRAASRHLRDGGRIVSVASLAAHNGGGPGAFAYAAGKAGLIGLTRALAKELAPQGITVNAIAPGFILDTPFHEEFTPPAAQEAAVQATPLGRAGYPADTAAAVEFLVSPDAGFITGVVLDVNGGTYFA